MNTHRLMGMSMALTALCTLAGCSESEPERAYDAPDALCGTRVDQSTVSQLLPPGKELDVQEKNPVPSRKRCQVNVDGEAALRVSQEWWKHGSGVADVAKGIPQLETATLTDDNEFMQTGTAAAKRARCDSPEHGDGTLFVTVQVYADGVDDPAAVKRLATSYAHAVEGSLMCR
ncbi:hypothetical protein ACFWR9_28895 [Streptomyces sp. NPDC058534]|uniref:hypothetical protein n=1 Tax=Streptomyces sp. NPDC058534 TaxID=3346541 RepID=UPI00364D6D95